MGARTVLVDFDEGSIHHHGVQVQAQVFGQAGETVIAEHAILAPAVETLANGVPLAKLRRQAAPAGTGALDPKYGFQDSAVIVFGERPP